MSAETLQASMKHESQCKKCCIAIGSIVHLLFAGCVGLVYCLWWRNVNQIQSWAMENCTGSECDDPPTLYDIGPLTYFADGSSNFSDYTQATIYYADLTSECGSDATDSCWTNGNRWSVVYALCGITMLLLAVNSALMILGAWSFHARGLAACCGSLCCCLNLSAIITTGVFRYNTWGNFSALCTGASKYDDMDAVDLNSDRTYESDAAVITGLWICQMIFCLTNCCHTGYAGKPTEMH